MGVPDGPTCHTGAHTCYFSRVDGEAGAAEVEDGGRSARGGLVYAVRARGDDQEATRRGSRRRDEAVVDSSPLGQSRAPVREGQREAAALRDAREGRGKERAARWQTCSITPWFSSICRVCGSRTQSQCFVEGLARLGSTRRRLGRRRNEMLCQTSGGARLKGFVHYLSEFLNSQPSDCRKVLLRTMDV